MTARETVLIAGAGLAGARTAETLRALDWRGRILLVGDEPHAPYERPALSKTLLAGTRHDVSLRPASFWDEQEIELRLGTRVRDVETRRRTAWVGGEEIRWDALVLATGAAPRRLGGPPGVHHLRSLDDARMLAAELTARTRLVVVGAGFIGGEVASTAAPLVGSVTVIDPAGWPLERVLGREVGTLLASRYRNAGVDLRLGTGVSGFEGESRVTGVRLADGIMLAADVVVVGIGAVPQTPDGMGPVSVDASGRSDVADIYACGDVASWWRPSLGRHVRVEHWTSAAGQARAVAAAIVGDEQPYDEQPYFWSDQFGLRIQHVGSAGKWHQVLLDGADDAFTARYVDRDGRLLAALTANRPAEIGGLRRELAA
jgi:3-phenylpropionate/trans-cinnamate dioxygenase ferredoxin reductase subunit